jgi:hypothetical protein
MNKIKPYYNLSLVPTLYDLVNLGTKSPILKSTEIKCRTNDCEYRVITYDKDLLCCDLIDSYGLCRSVIFNIDNTVVVFSPPKSVSTDVFINKYHETKAWLIKAEEFVEGTMINVFFDPSSLQWEISTRNTVGATSKFYKSSTSKTFREMFFEAATVCNLDIYKLNKDLCYSFVMQHPNNRIVISFKEPRLFLVSVYLINNSLNNVKVYCLDIDDYKPFFNEMETTVQFPAAYEFDKYSDLIDKYASMNTSYDIVGVVIHNRITGERTKIRNPVYEQVRNLRGNQPKLQYQYLCLRQEGKVKDFLIYYPENKKEFSAFRDQLHLYTNALYTNYVSCYIKKEKSLMEYSEQYRTHMFNIHQHYMTELREKKLYINNTFVQKYVNEIHPSLLMYNLNFNMRKRMVKCDIA